MENPRGRVPRASNRKGTFLMSKLIAMVATAVMVGGVRTVIQPGEALPDLTKHDERELVSAGAAKSSDADTAQAKSAEREAAAAAAEFEAARKRVLDAQASTAVTAEADGSEDDSGKPAAAKPAAKTAKAAK